MALSNSGDDMLSLNRGRVSPGPVRSLLDRVGRCQALAGRIKYQTGKQAAAEREFRILMRSSPVGRVRPPSKELKRQCRYSSER